MDLALQEKYLTFHVMIEGHLVTLILQDPAFLAQIIKEGINEGITELDNKI